MPGAIIVVPCYNEEKRLPAEAILAFARIAHSGGVKFLMVNDGSKDGTLAVLRSLRDAEPAVIDVLDVQPNGGKAEAVRRGFLKAFKSDPDYVGFWDADLATPLDEIPTFLEIVHANPTLDMVLGSRVQLLGRDIQRQTLRHYLGRIFATVASNYLRMAIYDTQCGAKLFRNTPAVRGLFRERFISKWIFDVELLARYKIACRKRRLGNPADHIFEQPLRRWEDVKGSTVKGRDFLKAILEFAALVKKYR